MKNSSNEFQQRCSEYQSKLENLITEKVLLMKAAETLQKENFLLKKENDQLSAELIQLKSKISSFESEILQYSSIKSRESTLTERIKILDSMILGLKTELEQKNEQYKESNFKANNLKNQLIQENKDLANKVLAFSKLCERKDSEIEKKTQENNKLASDLACIEQHLCVKEDCNQIIDDFNKILKNLKEENTENLVKIDELNGKLIKNNKQIEELENVIKEKSEEIEVLISTVVKLQRNREIYAPVPSDTIDVALADYLNTLDTPLPVPFTREEEGIYLFGTKRIFVKLEQGKIIIRVGGGFMQVNDFIDIYTSNEVDKFTRQKFDRSQKLRQSFISKLEDSQGKDSSIKFSTCFGIQKRAGSITRSSLSPVNHTGSY